MAETYFGILGFDELSPGYGFPRLNDVCCKEPFPHKDRILSFLRHGGKPRMASTNNANDVFTGESIAKVTSSKCLDTYQHGPFTWNDVFIYYVDRYNAKPPEEFIDYVLSQT